jgi:uncharacterized membrane protein
MGLAGFGFWAEQNTRIGRLMTGIIVAMAATMLLANLKVIPFQAPVYDTIFSRILPLSIPARGDRHCGHSVSVPWV